MPIAPPPVFPPQQGVLRQERQQYQGAAHTVTLKLGPYSVYVFGNTLLRAGQVRAALQGGKNLSDAVRVLNREYRSRGYLLVHLRYAFDRKANVLYIRVIEGHLAAIRGGGGVAAYLRGLTGDPHPTMGEFRRQQVLAGIMTERAGLNVSTHYSFRQNDPAAAVMHLETHAAKNHSPLGVTLSAGNPGNRYVGRYFAGASLRAYNRFGGRAVLQVSHALPHLGNGPNSGHLDEVKLHYDQPTAVGVYGGGASYLEYRLYQNGFTYDGRIARAHLSGEQLLHASQATRLTISEQPFVSSYRLTGNPGNVTVLRERYAGLQVGSGFHHDFSVRIGGRRYRLGSFSSRLNLRKGLHASPGTFPSSSRGGEFLLGQLSMDLTSRIATDSTLHFHFEGQAANRRLPVVEQWVLGGESQIRAYLAGVMVGDQGIYGRTTLQLPRVRLIGLPWRLSLFAEAGSASFRNSSAPTTTLTDAGARLSIGPLAGVTAMLEAAEPLTAQNLSDQRLRQYRADSYFRVRVRF
ncbi:MAG TPA: ShlB/FhaC/HecB family hemolysin secretion/activation protein [Gammaproteobacteria bacterium]|nr:ShlB/FhaC/HecB family hemolysin secretion/activation protein [Gammaproteobacteria bacterium]